MTHQFPWGIHYPRLSSHPELRTVFNNLPRITHKRNTRPLSFPAKNIPCRHEQCATCPQLSSKSHYSSYQTKECFTIPDIFSCDTTAAIYLLECNICNKQYVGETHVTKRNRMKQK